MVSERQAGPRAGRMQVQGAAQSYRAFLRSEGGLLRELKECRHDSARVHLVCNNYGECRICLSTSLFKYSSCYPRARGALSCVKKEHARS
jgi:hypothetical protein